MKTKCPNCSYEWDTKSKMDFITCPNCQRKFRKVINNNTNSNETQLKDK